MGNVTRYRKETRIMVTQLIYESPYERFVADLDFDYFAILSDFAFHSYYPTETIAAVYGFGYI
jgi:hypothetical protein